LRLDRIIYALRKINDTVSIEGRAWRSEGTETNSFNDVFGAWLCGRIFFTQLLHKLSLQACPEIVEGLPQVTGSLPSLRRARHLIVALPLNNPGWICH
jgi:hypothetical protein